MPPSQVMAGGPPVGPGSGPMPPQMMHQQPMAGGPPPGMQSSHPPGPPMQGGPPPHPNPGQGPPQQMQEQPKLDNISKAKALVPQLKDSLMDVFKVAAVTISGNNMIDSGSKAVEIDPGRFDRTLEKFFSICDQMEVHLKTSIECLNQGISSQRYLPTPVMPTKMEGSLSYPQYIGVVKGQIAFAKEVHDTLAEAAQKLSE